MRAVIFHDVGKPITVEEVEIDEPLEHEVLVRTAASGICGSDLHYFDGTSAMPYPAVFGHEGAGVVEAVGSGVTEFSPGDHVIACLSVYCGECVDCLTGRTNLCELKPERTSDDPPRRSRERWRRSRTCSGEAVAGRWRDRPSSEFEATVGALPQGDAPGLQSRASTPPWRHGSTRGDSE